MKNLCAFLLIKKQPPEIMIGKSRHRRDCETWRNRCSYPVCKCVKPRPLSRYKVSSYYYNNYSTVHHEHPTPSTDSTQGQGHGHHTYSQKFTPTTPPHSWSISRELIGSNIPYLNPQFIVRYSTLYFFLWWCDQFCGKIRRSLRKILLYMFLIILLPLEMHLELEHSIFCSIYHLNLSRGLSTPYFLYVKTGSAWPIEIVLA